jgi:hypothetical protein
VSITASGEVDDLFEIEVSDLRPVARARRDGAAPGTRLSTRRRGWRFAASLLVMLLLALDLVPGPRISLPGALLVTPAGARGAAQPAWVARQAAQAAQLAPADFNSVWPSLWQRPLQLPGVAVGQLCPATPGRSFTEGYGPGLGSGPAFLLLPGPNDATLRAEALRGLGGSSKGWSGQQVRWVIHPLYQGPVLVRGARIDSAGGIQFNGGLDQPVDPSQLTTAPPLTHLRLVGDSSYGAPWIAWVTYLRVRESGCYALQVDGLSFSETIVFRAAIAKSMGTGSR